MTVYGETSTGFRGKTFAEAGADLRARLRARISQDLTLDAKDWLGNAVDIWADIEALLWEALEVARNQFDPDNAEGQLAVALAALTGTKRRQPTKGSVLCTLGLDAGRTFASGELVAHVEGQPDNRWVNRDQVVSTVAGTYTNVPFLTETAGRKLALANKLKIVAQTKSGWLSVNNPADATPGEDLESIPDLMARREEELGAGGSGTVAAIDKAVSAVEGVIGCRVFYNDSSSTQAIASVSMPPNSIRVVVWDGIGGAASNNALAQAILNTKSGGAPTLGSTSGTAVDVYGEVKTVNFTRVSYVQGFVAITVTAPIGTNTPQLTADIRASIVALWPTRIGQAAYANKLMAGPAALPAVLNVTSLTVGGPPPPPVASSFVATSDQILLINSSDIAVTVNLI